MTPDEFERHYGFSLDSLQTTIRTLAILSVLLAVENTRLKALEGPLVIDDGHMKHIRNERIKLQATLFNTIAAGFAVTGVIGPMATYLYGTTSQTSRSIWQVAAEIGILLICGATLHGLAYLTLGRLEQ